MTSSAFDLLDSRIQRFLWQAQWDALRPAQEQAIPVILQGEGDAIIAAPTAAGKTEAAFLPTLTAFLKARDTQKQKDALILYLSPLKALINDQFERLDHLCESLEIPVTPWHGDVPASKKNHFLKNPKGLLLITPESLEALLCRRGTEIQRIFKGALFVIIDELHAFIGSERGKQLQSLLYRIEMDQKRFIRRIGLSATLGNMALGAEFLRPSAGKSEKIPPVEIVDIGGGDVKMKILVKGYLAKEPLSDDEKMILEELSRLNLSEAQLKKEKKRLGLSEDDLAEKKEKASAEYGIAKDLFKRLLGSNHLIFPNTRQDVENYTHLLNGFCDQKKISQQFWPHHGSLSPKLRLETEQALKQKDQPAIGICTSTLELGIDINSVKSIAQINPPPSVANLRQRMGRSGRGRGEHPILRGYVLEKRLDEKSSLEDRLRLHSLQMSASISLLLKNWCEPPQTKGLHLSTLVQQLLSLISQYNGIQPGTAYKLLCGLEESPFRQVSPAQFKLFLSHLGQIDLLIQDHSGTLLHGEIGDRIVNNFEFYASFKSQDEFRLVSNGKTLGTLPIKGVIKPKTTLLFAGKAWMVQSISEAEKTLYLTETRRAAVKIHGEGGRVHHQIRQEMRRICAGSAPLRFLDPQAQEFIHEARMAWREFGLSHTNLIDHGDRLQILTWAGDNENEAIMCYLNAHEISARNNELGIMIDKEMESAEEILERIKEIKADPKIPLEKLLKDAQNLQREKWDWALPEELLWENYASANLNLEAGSKWLNDFAKII
ncbi:DEAD/DEAH box helicase [Acetobacteraceae bacterium]|nr:DEAD/DEAH box helicase [Acetobacteraceae bacterium]